MTTLELQVESSNRDGYQDGSGNTYISVTLAAVTGPNGWFAGAVEDVTIPPGSTINSAEVDFYVHSTTYDDFVAHVHLELAANPAVLTAGSGNYNISGRSLTTNYVNVNATSVGEGWYTVTGLASALQEVVNLGGWASGNPVNVIVDAQSGISLQLRFQDYSGNEHGFILTVDFTEPGGATRQQMFYARLRG